jgi:hypothetical protein
MHYTCFMILLCTAFWGAPARAQEILEEADSVSVLRKQLDEKRIDHARMKRILASLNAVDSAYKVQYPTWIVLDEDIRERILRAFRPRYPTLAPQSDIVVVVNPGAKEILEITVGTTVMGRRETYLNLSDSLHREILGGSYPKRTIDPRPLRPRPAMLPQPSPRFASLSASAFGASLLFSGGRGVELKLGHEEIGYFFWSTGDLRIMAVLNEFKFGLMVPFTYGRDEADVPSPLAIRNRLMAGARGISGEWEQFYGDQSFGANFSVGEVNKAGLQGILPNLDSTYYLHTVAQLRYGRSFSLGSPEHKLLLTGGIGYHQIALGVSTPAHDRITAVEKEDFVSPILRAEYIHDGPYRYSISVQYYSAIFYAKAWMELLPDFLFLEMQYYTPFLRDPQPWEHPYFFMISPRIQIAY